MKTCPNCNIQLDDNAIFCGACGTKIADSTNVNQQENPTISYTPYVDPYDHTAEFDPKDISDNKVIAMLVYLMGAIGIIIALLLSNSSKYVAFHLRQALKFLVIEILMPIALAAGLVVCIVPILGWIVYGLALLAVGIANITFFVLKIICFFQICQGKAKEPAIIRNLNFLK